MPDFHELRESDDTLPQAAHAIGQKEANTQFSTHSLVSELKNAV